MSFITKRERVFHDVELCDLPPRNEGKLKAYASCTDARAWSHFGTSKTEHLTELIKRNNDLSKPVKYVPTKVIVDTLMASKNMEIGRLKRKIEEFEQMLAAYDELDLDCAQKCEIAKAHAAIKAANKDLDELCLNLDISTCTDGFETESFETGKSRSVQYSANWSMKSKGGESDRSRGDAWTVMLDKDLATQGNQTSLVCPCDVSVSVEDPRIDEMKEQIISKDAKLNAMRNSLAIMENDICEPFGIYAHIYTALEKIFGVLSQNSKYRQYLNLMTAGKDIRCIDIKGKILFKMKVLEKFCLALIAPCSKEFSCSNAKDCQCYYANINTKLEHSYRLTPDDCTSSDSTKRSRLVADIMENEEMKEILSKESALDENDDSESDNEKQEFDTASSINQENQKRIKDLQECYEDLLNCYENLKHETDCIRVRCAKYEDLELELERLRGQLTEYNSVWNEKEHYRKRSEDLDTLKQQYIVLAEESSGLETKLKAESEINHIKADAIDELRAQNMSLEKRLNEIYIVFEKDKNNLQCQLQESECKCMCQEQQIKSLNSQITKLLEQHSENMPREDASLLNENESLKQQLKQYQDIEYEFQDKMSHINELETEIARWRAAYKELFECNKLNEDRIEDYNTEKERLLKENSALREAIRDKSDAVENLMAVIKVKSLEIHKLTDDNQNINSQLVILGEKYENYLNLSRQESQELLGKLKDYDDFVQKQDDLSNDIEQKMREYESLKINLKSKMEENEKLKNALNLLQNEDAHNKMSLEISKKESSIMERKLSELEDISQQFMNLKDAFEQLSAEKNELERELRKKASQLESTVYSIKLNKKESGELLKQSEFIQGELQKLHLDNDSLQQQIDKLREENKELKVESARLSNFEHELSDLKKAINELLKEKVELEHRFKIKEQELSNMHTILESKIEENQSLIKQLDSLKSYHLNENELHQTELERCKRESMMLIEKLQSHNRLENKLQELQIDHEAVKKEKDRLQRELEAQLLNLQKIQEEKRELQNRTDDLLAHTITLEKKMVDSRNELIQSSLPEKTPLAGLMEEIQKLRVEKTAGQQKIRELLHKLDESDQVIANFEDEMQSRDSKIATMQNHINDLEVELRKLQYHLEKALDTGEDIKNTNLSIEQSRKQIEAHHSKASHNIKLDLAVLQQSKSVLENQLSITKSQYEIALNKNKQNYLSEIYDLKNDREIIVTDLKQLEIYSVGDSELTSDNCEIERILNSLDRIRKAFDAKRAKTASLEQTLSKVQASSQLILSTADEAKTHFENEKQKILDEKEDALKENNNLTKQLIDLKNELNKQISQDGDTIKNLQAEILNHKLIIDKINDSTEKYIKSLQDEIQSLKDLYQVAHSNIRQLQEKLSTSTADNEEKENTIQNLMADLENKNREISELKSKFDNLAKYRTNKAVQIQGSDNYRDISSQTDNVPHVTLFDLTGSNTSVNQVAEQDASKINKYGQRDSIQPMYDLLPQQKPPSVNEVHILAAEVQPTFDFVRSSYLNYKIKRLGPGLLEIHSIPSPTASINSYIEELHDMSDYLSADPYNMQDAATHSSNEDLVNIYHSPSDDIQSSSKVMDVSIKKKNSVDTYGHTRPGVISKNKSTSHVGEEIKPTGKHRDTQKREISEKHSENVKKKSADSGRKREMFDVKLDNTTPSHLNEEQTDRTKVKLSINLPVIGVESNSYATTTNNENNSSDSYTFDIYSQPVKEPTSDTTVMIPSSSDYNTKSGSLSLPTISNAGDIYIKSRNFIELPTKESSLKSKTSISSYGKTIGDKPSYSPGHFIVYEDSRVSVTKQQHIQKPDEKKADIVTNAEKERNTSILSENFSITSSDKSDDSINHYLTESNHEFKSGKSSQDKKINATADDLTASYVAHDNNKVHFVSDNKNKANKSKSPEQKVEKLSKNVKTYHKGRLASDRKYTTETGKVRSNDSNGSLFEKKIDNGVAHHAYLSRLEPDVFLKMSKSSSNLYDSNDINNKSARERRSDFALTYILDSFMPDPVGHSGKRLMSAQSEEMYANDRIQSWISKTESIDGAEKHLTSIDQSVMVNLDRNDKYYEEIIAGLRKSVEDAEKDHKMQIEAIKIQYDRNIKNIINEHNQGVMRIQSIHEETLRDVMRVHENEVENLRTISIEAMRKVDKLEKSLKSKISIDAPSLLDEVPTKCDCFLEGPKPRPKPPFDTKVLTKTALEAFDVKPKLRAYGPCTCSLDINISDTIRNIFEQVDVEQRKLAEVSYLRYIATKIANGQIEALDTQELSFVHLKVCRIWKQKLNKEEALQKKLDSLEVELIRKQKFAQQHMAELDRKVAQEKRRLEEVREAVCRSSPVNLPEKALPVRETAENSCSCPCNQTVSDRRSAGDLVNMATSVPRTRRKHEHKAATTRTDAEEKRDRRLYSDEPPTRLRRPHDRSRVAKK